ncbi:MAG: hydantoinase/oxoprolinase family protein [Opitutaceae bacterium]|jgi:N-methylhydantoinase A/oxoprolinase/acetone carboxylase beta subunit|nr:hydantoinase/oxoprolinase family protein [Opitutaceae bacterium]
MNIPATNSEISADREVLRGDLAAVDGFAGKLINIDNGGTLTDICVIDGQEVYRTKTMTTPHDLSECLFEGIKKASRLIYGEDAPLSLLRSTQCIRYSTTQGTNALVERKGPRLGLIVGGGLTAAQLREHAAQSSLFDNLVADRVVELDFEADQDALDDQATRAVGMLSSSGANRIVFAIGGVAHKEHEARLKRLLLRKFPPHLLGAIPILYSHELVEDSNHPRRAWTALFNAFLHPAMERFLYNADHKLRDYRSQNPLLIFRNDGHSARVARTTAVKTYSSGPRGGMEGARALVEHYGFQRLLTMDIGGTTTDIGLVEKIDGRGVIRADLRGRIEGVESSFPLCDVVSAGVGGSSIIRGAETGFSVGPESVGSAPGPACFGFGGKEATITDAFLLNGLLDPRSYFGGQMQIDVERARAAIVAHAGTDNDAHDVANLMEAAWVAKVAASLTDFAPVDANTTLAAFGGAGPFVVCKIAEAVGVDKIVIPGLAAIFSAFGIGFSDIAHQFEAELSPCDATALVRVRDQLLEMARRAMFAEGFALDACEVRLTIFSEKSDTDLPSDASTLPEGFQSAEGLGLRLTATKRLPHAPMKGSFGNPHQQAQHRDTRRVRFGEEWIEAPLYCVEDLPAGASASGPAVLEEAFFTCRIDAGWRFEINEARDILLTRN